MVVFDFALRVAAALTLGAMIGAERQLRAGDKVMQLRNDYDREVFNGDLGRVVTQVDGEVTVRFDERLVRYGVDALDRIMRLQKVCFAGARAATAHVDAAERSAGPAVEHCDSGIGAAIVPDAHAV